MSGYSGWQARVREQALAYVYDAARAEDGSVSADSVASVLEVLYQAPEELALLRSAYFVMQHWATLYRFLGEEMPQLVRSLSRASSQVVQEMDGHVEGSIDWGLTLAARAVGSPRTAYVCVTPITHYATPENQALVWVLTALADTAGRTLRAVSGAAGETAHPDQQTAERLGERCAFLQYQARRWLAHSYLRGIPVPVRLDNRCRTQLDRSRNPLYRLVAEVLRRLEESDRMEQVLQQTVLLPASADTLFELYTLMAVVRALPTGPGWRIERRVLWSGQRRVARAENVATGRSIEVYYNRAVLGGGKGGLYKQVFAAYDIDVGSRRPDITIRITEPEHTARHLLVEVKRTTDRGYIVDSVYKVLGYLQDFTADLGPPLQPQAVLVVEGGIQRLGEPTGPVVILTADELEGRELSDLLAAMAGT